MYLLTRPTTTLFIVHFTDEDTEASRPKGVGWNPGLIAGVESDP